MRKAHRPQTQLIVVSLVIVFLGAIWMESAMAIPVFARKYRTACPTCHIAIPKRNAFGETFRRNGYRMPVDDEVAVKEDPVSLGSEAWKQVWPQAIWPGSLPGTVPIGAYVHMRSVWQEEDEGEDVVDLQFDMPHEVELLFGGALGENISFFGEWLLFEKGKVDEGRLGSFFLQYSDVFGDDKLNLKFGRYDVGALSGYNAFKEDNRLTLAHYRPNDYKVVPSSDKVPGSGGKINYRWRYRDKQSGIEANGILADRFEYIVGVVNGNGSTREFDDHKDFYYRFSYKIGGETMTMKNAPEELQTSDNWRDDSITIGTHGYFGKTMLTSSGSAGSWTNDFERFGVDLRAKYDRWEVGAAVIWGTDDDPGGPRGLAPINDVDATSWMVGATYIIYPWLMPTVRYESLHYDKDFASDVDNWIVSLTALQRANMRWAVEYVFHPNDDEGRDTFKINLQWAF